MKSRIIFLIIALSALFSSCLVNSLYPFYEENNVYFDKNLIGDWIDQDSTKWYVKQMYLSYGKDDKKEEYACNGYVIRYTREQPEPFKKNVVNFDVFLFKINDQLYADFSPSMFPTFDTWGINDFGNLHSVRTHTLAKVNLQKDKFELVWFNGDWLAELIENNRIKISHEFIPFSKPYSLKYKGQYILTAKTRELQSFIKKYGSDPNAFVRKKDNLKNGFYTWNVGPDYYTGEMSFRKDSTSYYYNLKKIK